MHLLQMLQEASSLSIPDLKKAMLKDSKAKLLFKKDLTLADIPNAEEFLATVKYYILNNDSVRNFVAMRNNVKALDTATLAEYRKLRGPDLTEDKLKWLREFVTDLFKEHNSTAKAIISPDLKKQLKDWFNGNRRYFNLPAWATRELMAVPSLRPSKRVLLYRGVLFSEDSLTSREKYDGTLEVGNGLAFLRSIKKGGKEVDLKWDRPSSWTTSKEIATRFAKYGPASSQFGAMMQWFDRGMKKREIDGELGFVISTFANPEDILLDTHLLANVESQHGDEGEIILKAGTYSARIVKKYTVEGEVTGDEPEAPSKITPALEAFDHFKEAFNLSSEIKALIKEIDNGPKTWSSYSIGVLKNLPVFKKLISNGTTTEVVHSFDKAIDFYNKELIALEADDTRADKFANDEAKGKRVTDLKKFMSRMTSVIHHSKLKSDKNSKGLGKTHQLTGEEYRSTIKAFDVDALSKDLLVHGRIVSREGDQAFSNLAGALGGLNFPSSARFVQFGAAKQEPVITEAIDKFFKSIGLSKNEDRQENIKTMTNLLRKAYRNYALVEELELINQELGNKND